MMYVVYVDGGVMTNCTPNTSPQEQISFVLQCVDVSSTQIHVFEYFLELLKVDDTTGKCLFDAIMNEINNLDLILIT